MGGQASSATARLCLGPILSLRRSLVLAPGERVQLSLVLAAAHRASRYSP